MSQRDSSFEDYTTSDSLSEITFNSNINLNDPAHCQSKDETNDENTEVDNNEFVHEKNAAVDESQATDSDYHDVYEANELVHEKNAAADESQATDSDYHDVDEQKEVHEVYNVPVAGEDHPSSTDASAIPSTENSSKSPASVNGSCSCSVENGSDKKVVMPREATTLTYIASETSKHPIINENTIYSNEMLSFRDEPYRDHHDSSNTGAMEVVKSSGHPSEEQMTHAKENKILKIKKMKIKDEAYWARKEKTILEKMAKHRIAGHDTSPSLKSINTTNRIRDKILENIRLSQAISLYKSTTPQFHVFVTKKRNIIRNYRQKRQCNHPIQPAAPSSRNDLHSPSQTRLKTQLTQMNHQLGRNQMKNHSTEESRVEGGENVIPYDTTIAKPSSYPSSPCPNDKSHHVSPSQSHTNSSPKLPKISNRYLITPASNCKQPDITKSMVSNTILSNGTNSHTTHNTGTRRTALLDAFYKKINTKISSIPKQRVISRHPNFFSRNLTSILPAAVAAERETGWNSDTKLYYRSPSILSRPIKEPSVPRRNQCSKNEDVSNIDLKHNDKDNTIKPLNNNKTNKHMMPHPPVTRASKSVGRRISPNEHPEAVQEIKHSLVADPKPCDFECEEKKEPESYHHIPSCSATPTDLQNITTDKKKSSIDLQYRSSSNSQQSNDESAESFEYSNDFINSHESSRSVSGCLN